MYTSCHSNAVSYKIQYSSPELCPTLYSGAQINGMTLTGAADPAAGFSGMVQWCEVKKVA